MKRLIGLLAAFMFLLVMTVFQRLSATAQDDLGAVIFSIAWSPDGSKLAVGTSSKIEILDANHGTLLKTLTGSRNAVSAVDWSPDSTRVAGASFDMHGLAIWDVTTGEITASQSVDTVAVKWHPDGKRVAAADTSINIGIWNTVTGQDVLLALPGSAMDWSPDGNTLVSAIYDEPPITITDITTGQTLLTLPGHANGVADVDWSPDGGKIASGGSDNTVRVWDATTGEALLELRGHTGLVTAVAWRFDSTILASGSSDGTVRFWDVQTGEAVSIVQADDKVRAIAWSPDGTRLAYGGDSGTVQTATPIPAPTEATPIPGAAFPTTDVLDDFDRADGAIGDDWVIATTGYSIADDQLDVESGGSIYWNKEQFGTDQEAFVTLVNIDPASEEIDLLLKWQPINSDYRVIEVWYQPSSRRIQVWTHAPGEEWVQRGGDIPATFAAGDQFGARAKADGTVEVYQNGTLLGSVDISMWGYAAEGGGIGIWTINAADTVFDDFGGGDSAG